MMKSKTPKLNTFSKNFKVLRLVFRFCPQLLWLAVIYIICSVVASILKVYLISEAISYVLSGGSFIGLITKVLYILIAEVICLFGNVLYEDFFEPRYRNIYVKKIQTHLFKKVKEIDMLEYDNPVFYNKFSRALRDSQWRGFRVYRTIIDFIKSVCISLALGTYVIITDSLLIIVILVSSIVGILAINEVHKLWYRLFKETELEHRFSWYINRTFYNVRYAAELKTTTVSDLLIDKYKDSVNSLEKKTFNINKKMIPHQVVFNLFDQFLAQGATYLYLGIRLFKGLIEVSEFSSSINATMSFYNNFMAAMTTITTLKEHARYIDDFLWVMDYKPKLEKNEGFEIDEFKQIKIENINFKYHESKDYVINNLSFELNIGDKIAIVGHNGSGKTTLIKLILKFYELQSGNIYINDINYNDVNPFSLRRHMAVVFQDYQIYAVSIAENILMHKVRNKADEEKVYDALDKVGLLEKVKSLKQGIYTEMTREFDTSGEAFSGGERQRIVVARVFATNADLYILDEPTASLDPLAEEKINKLILNTAVDKTIIIIAHRLSTVVDTDKIYLMKQGTFTEIGTHQELLKLNGDYALMFNTQKQLYESNE
ncbi:MAG: ABC transporter ATP-binding protein [Erysipelotrichaceae bacterium]|nr:ABC transporter ATP-binding protein [Erysipelotrichaceae bacterium]